MLVISILGGLLAVALVIYALSAFERYAAQRFHHRFFTLGAFFAAAAAIGCIVGGRYWGQAALEQGEDVSNGLVLQALGALMMVGIFVRNVWRAGMLVGTCGSVLQASVFGVIGSFGLIVLGVGLVLGFVGVLALNVGASPVYVVNRW